MPLEFILEDDSEKSLVTNDEQSLCAVLTALTEKATPEARRALKLGASASVAAALAAAARIDKARLAPLTKTSSGIYAEEDYLAQFEEEWEREEYGRAAASVVKKNRAAWQRPEALASALDAAIEALADVSLAALVFPAADLQPRESLQSLRRLLAEAMAAGATKVCIRRVDPRIE